MKLEWVRDLEILPKRKDGELICSIPVTTWSLYQGDRKIAVHREIPDLFQLSCFPPFYIYESSNKSGKGDMFQEREMFKRCIERFLIEWR